MTKAVSWVQLLEEVAAKIGTPFFVYDPVPARQKLAALQRAMKVWGESRVAYSLKTNPLGALLEDMRAASAWIEVVSVEEFSHALRWGFQAKEVVFNGPLKAAGIPPESLDVACLNIDGLEEIDVLASAAMSRRQKLRVGLRICTPLTSPSWSRFGLNLETGEVTQAVEAVRSSKYLELAGLHAHLGTQVEDLRSYSQALALLRGLWDEIDLPADGWLDLGGGFPVAHDENNVGRLTIDEEFFRSLGEIWGQPRPLLIIEPGRIVAAPSITMVTRVLAKKRRPREPDILVLDGGTNHNVMGAFYEHSWEFSCVESTDSHYRFCGPLCMEDDIMSGERMGPAPKVGALAVMKNSGAYSLALARPFIQSVPPVVRLNEGSFEVIVDRGDFRGIAPNPSDDDWAPRKE